MDLNADGNIDLMGAGFAGLTYILYGKADGSFNEAVVVTDKDGNDLHLGMYYDFKKDGYVTLFEEHGNKDKGDFAKFHDWDNDGDLDLIMSGGEGAYLFINEGSKTKPAFNSKYTKVIPEYFADVFADWDEDGLWDIIGGSKSGGAYFYKNTGKLGNPKFDKAVCLFESKEISKSIERSKGGMTQIAVTDYNNDGKLDIVMGNNTTVAAAPLKLTKEQIAEKEKLQKEMDIKKRNLNSYIEEFDKKNKSSDPNAIKKDKKYKELFNDYIATYRKTTKYSAKSLNHGYVFVSLRK